MSFTLPALLTLFGCTPELPTPTLTAIVPSRAWYREETQVTLLGDNLYPEVEVDLREGGGRLDHQFTIHLEGAGGTWALEGVSPQTYDSLMATVPAGLAVGWYDVVLESPGGAQARLQSSFEVTSTRADHLAFQVDDVAYTVNEPIDLLILLEDPMKERVYDSLEVALDITAPGLDQDSLTVVPGSLAQAQVLWLDEEVLITGYLTELGAGSVGLYAQAPLDLFLVVSPLDTASSIQEDSLWLSVDAGEVEKVLVDLPSEEFLATAGVPFPISLQLVDYWDNPRDDAAASLTLYEECGEYLGTVEFVGHAVVSAAVERATSSLCTANRILVAGTAAGESDLFQVDPGPVDSYLVNAFPNEITAGSETLNVVVQAQDAWGNLLTDYGDTVGLSLSDNVGGLDITGTGDQVCPGFDGGLQVCYAWPVVASNAVVVTAKGTDDIRGSAPSIRVVPDALVDLTLELPGDTILAGEPFVVSVLPQDAHGNSIFTNPTVDAYSWSSSTGSASCTWYPEGDRENWRSFTCQTCEVTGSEQLQVVLDASAGSATALSDPFTVRNGPIASVTFHGIEPDGSVRAGESTTLDLEARDGCGNDYLYQPWGSEVVLTDRTGTLAPGAADLDALGRGRVGVTMTRSLEANLIEAWFLGARVGSTASFSVEAGDFKELRAFTETPWAFVGEPLSCTVEALDAWANRVPGFEGPVQVRSTLGTLPATILPTFTDGVAEGDLTFLSRATGETLLFEAAAPTAASSEVPVDVLEDGCGVIASLSVDGTHEAVLCRSPDTGAAALADLSLSTGSDLAYYLSDGGDILEHTTEDTLDLEWVEDGRYTLDLVAFDPTGCGDRDQALVYVALDDGSPAGPLLLSPSHTDRTIGDADEGVAIVEITAYDCAGDPATSGDVGIRADLGELTGGVSSSGEGLLAAVGPDGEATVTWSVATETHGGTATLFAGRPDGAAYGSTTIEAVGDDAWPHVVAISPQGQSSTTSLQVLSVWFDEAMRPENFSFPVQSVTVAGASAGDLGALDLSWDESDLRLDVSLPTAIDAGTDTWTLTVLSQVRDMAGNRLEGTWSGTSAAFSALFGAVEDRAPDVEDCAEDTSTLRPDGDGLAHTAEADSVQVAVSTDPLVPPAWWYLEVTDATGSRVLERWQPASGSLATLEWDGRNVDGRVVPNGSYSLVIAAMDTNLNLGRSCSTVLLVDNRIEAP